MEQSEMNKRTRSVWEVFLVPAILNTLLFTGAGWALVQGTL